MKKLLLSILAISPLFASAVIGFNSNYLSQFAGTWNGTTLYKIRSITNTYYFSAPMVLESNNGSLYIMNGSIAAPINVLPESSSAWTKVSTN